MSNPISTYRTIRACGHGRKHSALHAMRNITRDQRMRRFDRFMRAIS